MNMVGHGEGVERGMEDGVEDGGGGEAGVGQ